MAIKNKRRREMLRRAARSPDLGLPVNNKWQLGTKRDGDLKKLIKQGYMTLTRLGGTGRKRSAKRQTIASLTLKGYFAAAQVRD